MNKLLGACTLAIATAFAASAHANEKLAASSGCNTCHAPDKKLIGPGYKEIAQKYRNDKGAEAGLIKKVKGGGKGVWGEMPMPPNAHVKDEDVKTLVQWILSQK